VFDRAQRLEAVCQAAQQAVKPRFQSDLRCAMALAMASSESARTLILTNLAWLDDPQYSKRMRHRLQTSARRRRR
jgi:hypothetical protein